MTQHEIDGEDGVSKRKRDTNNGFESRTGNKQMKKTCNNQVTDFN